MRSALLSLSLLLLLLPSAFPQEEEDGQAVDPIQNCLELLKSQSDADFEQAMTILTDQAQKNDDSALFLLGSIYETGKKVPRNFTKAMEYFNASAELGNADAMQSLGFMWGTGKGVTINKPLSLLYYAFAAQGKSIAASLTLGYKYFHGHDVPKSCSKAATRYEYVASQVVEEYQRSGLMGGNKEYVRLSEEFEMAKDRRKEEEDVIQYYQYSADTGDPSAQVTMGTLHLQGGHGVEQNFGHAFDYFQRAAGQGDPGGLSNLGFMYANGHGTEQDNDTAIKFYRRAAEKGHPHAQTQLGYMYIHGYGVPKNVKEAIKYFKKAADQGHAEGLLNLGILYYNGDNVKQNYAEALSYFTLAAQQGHLVAIFYLAQMHHYGFGTSPSCHFAVQLYKRVAEKGMWSSIIMSAYSLYKKGDIEGALLHYEKAAEQGYEVAQSNAGWLYDKGFGQLQKYPEEERFRGALEYLRKSAEQKNVHSYLRLGDYYFSGFGTPVDYEKAAFYYQAASEMRSAQATFNLGYMHQYGLGLPRDLHLAKRNYDTTLSVEPDAYLAVYSMLFLVGCQFLKDWYSNDSLLLFGLNLDTVAIILIATILVVCVVIRSNRV